MKSTAMAHLPGVNGTTAQPRARGTKDQCLPCLCSLCLAHVTILAEVVKRCHDSPGSGAAGPAAVSSVSGEAPDGPEGDGAAGTIERVAGDFAAEAAMFGALDFDQGEDAVLDKKDASGHRSASIRA